MRFALKTTLAAATLALAGTAASAQDQTIVDIAVGNADFETLVAAVTAAGLAETLASEGPFTVFAPTDDAFAALPEGTVDDLLKPENKDKLTQVLLYHVVPGKVMSGDIPIGTMAADTAAEGEKLCVTLDGGVMLDDGSGGGAQCQCRHHEAGVGVGAGHVG